MALKMAPSGVDHPAGRRPGDVARILAHRRTLLGAKDTVVLADFANSTGDSVFDETLREGLVIELEQSPFLGLISDQRIQHMLPLMGHRADARITPEIARRVC